jgi:dihydrofolate reductase
MRDLIASEWTTLDGVYDADTMPEWFEPFASEQRQDYIREMIHSAGGLLLGRVTYEMFVEYWPQQKNNEFGMADRMNSIAKFVVSTSLKETDWTNSTVIKGDVEAEVMRLKQQAGRPLLVPGSGTLVETLLRAGLVDELRLLVHPIVAGEGKRFFSAGMGKTALELMETDQLEHGVVLLRYQPVRGEATREAALEEEAVATGPRAVASGA